MYRHSLMHRAAQAKQTAWRRALPCFGIVLCLLLGNAATPTRAAPQMETQAVLAVVQRLFDAMRTRDEQLLRGVFAPEARLGSNGIEDFIRAVLTGERHLDEVTFDETVLIDEDLAMAWTPYNLFVDGAFQHCGVDVFVMRRRDGQWLITQLDDTRRTHGCDPARRGNSAS